MKAWKYSGLYGIRTNVAYITAMVFLHIVLSPAVHKYDFHMLITLSSSFYGFITNQFNDLLPVGLLAQLEERCTSIAEVKGSNFVRARNFFRLSFRNHKSCIYNCDDLPSYSSSLRSSHIWFSYIHNFTLGTVSKHDHYGQERTGVHVRRS